MLSCIREMTSDNFAQPENIGGNTMTTNYISKEKAELHLKLGRRLAVFIKVDVYFESVTFDWISIEKQDNQYKTTLIRSINQGDDIVNDVFIFRHIKSRRAGL